VLVALHGVALDVVLQVHAPRAHVAGAYTHPLFSSSLAPCVGYTTSPLNLSSATFRGLGCVLDSSKRLRLGWEVDASCDLNDWNWLRLS
jgi:hypothetical protein